MGGTKIKSWFLKDKKNRYHVIDAIRGLAVINMVLFHFCFDYFVVYGRDVYWFLKTPVHIWQQAICCTFIFIAGFSWNLGKKKNWLRGLFINLCGIIITIATAIIVPDETVWFGILTFIGCAILVMIPLDLLLKNVTKKAGAYLGMAVSLVLFLLFYNVSEGTIGLSFWFNWKVPEVLYNCKILTPLGFPYYGFCSGDYFAFFPWFFLFVMGYFFYAIFDRYDSLKKAVSAPIPVLAFIGRFSIWIYLIHQPLGMLVCELFSVFDV